MGNLSREDIMFFYTTVRFSFDLTFSLFFHFSTKNFFTKLNFEDRMDDVQLADFILIYWFGNRYF